MPNSQASRTLLIGAVFFVAAALSVMRFFEGDHSREADDELTPPAVIHVARETKPTIVRPKDDWLPEESGPAAGPTNGPFSDSEVHDAQYLSPPTPLDDIESSKILRR